MSESFWSDFRRFFIRGLAAALPTLVTVAIIAWTFDLIQKYLGDHINQGAQWLTVKLLESIYPAAANTLTPQFWNTYLWWIGFLLALVGLYIFGRFVASFIGKAIWRYTESALLRMPVVKQIYPYIKQVTDFLLSERKYEFSRVVMVEYPRKGVWALGLVTGTGMRHICKAAGKDLLTVFVPTSPTPFTGYTMMIDRSDVVDLPITIDEAIRFIVSGGVIIPIAQIRNQAEIEQARQSALSSDKGEVK